MTSIPSYPRHGGSNMIVYLSIAVALVLSVFPFPDWLDAARPEWVALCLLYWSLTVPHRVGVGFAWCTGLLLDVLRGTVLGQHALSLTVAVYLAMLLHQRIRAYPLGQQALSVLVLITLHLLVLLWINGMIGKAPTTWVYWLPAAASAVLWPAVYVVLQEFRRSFGVS